MNIDSAASQAKDRFKYKHGKGYFAFSVDMSDIAKELNKFNKAIATTLLNTVKTKHPAKIIRERIEQRLAQETNTTSPRVRSILFAMKKGTKYSSFEKGSGRITGAIKGIRMQTIDYGIMDKETNIKALDKRHPQKHIAAFASPANPVKKMRQAAKDYRELPKFALWRMFEYKTKSVYDIPRVAQGPLKFTSKRDNYGSWVISKRVRWFGGSTMGVAASSYYILNKNRHLYKNDQKVFSDVILHGIKKIIKTKTRF